MCSLHLMQGFIFLVITSTVTPGRLGNRNVSSTNGRHGNRNVSRCDALHSLCHYPYECLCFYRLHFGPMSSTWYHYSSFTDECIPGGERFNCNGFPTKAECQRRCNFSRPSQRRKKLS
uniref:Pancreatic trypsin inhibitor n=1 Tax=Rhipicephalus appendiculatus TaxID=34631 RepID=A0A131Z6R7_RHIAP